LISSMFEPLSGVLGVMHVLVVFVQQPHKREATCGAMGVDLFHLTGKEVCHLKLSRRVIAGLAKQSTM
jgi:hypothetical protein